MASELRLQDRTTARIGHWIDGAPVPGIPADIAEVTNPATGVMTGQVSLATREETASAVRAAAKGVPAVARHLTRPDADLDRMPGHFGPPWFPPFAGAYHRLRDIIG